MDKKKKSFLCLQLEITPHEELPGDFNQKKGEAV